MYYKNCYFSIGAEFNKKFYINFGSVLRAAKLIRVDFYLGSGEFYCTFNVAGLGLVEEEIKGDSMNLKVEHLKAYASLDDFKAGKRMSILNRNGGMSFRSYDVIKGAFGNIATICGCDPFRIVRYKWNGTKAEIVELDLECNIWMDENGFHTNEKIPANTFRTKEECESVNQISVIEFED